MEKNVRAANELKKFTNAWDKNKIESDLAQKKNRMEIQPATSAKFCWILQENSSKSKEVIIAILSRLTLTHTRYLAHNVSWGKTLIARPLTAVTDDSDTENLTALTIIHLLLGKENANAPFMPFSEHCNVLKKFFNAAQSYAGVIWKRWIREYLPH